MTAPMAPEELAAIEERYHRIGAPDDAVLRLLAEVRRLQADRAEVDDLRATLRQFDITFAEHNAGQEVIIKRLQAERDAALPVGQTVERLRHFAEAQLARAEAAEVEAVELRAEALRWRLQALSDREGPPVGQTVEQAVAGFSDAIYKLSAADHLLGDLRLKAEAVLKAEARRDEARAALDRAITARDAEVVRAAEAKILRDVASALQKAAPEIAAKLVEGWRVATGEELLEALRAPAPAEKEPR